MVAAVPSQTSSGILSNLTLVDQKVVKLYLQTIVSLMMDTISMLYAAFQTLAVKFDWTRSRFDYYGANPTSLKRSSRRTDKVAVLCLNGLFGSEADFLPLISTLTSGKRKLSVFTETIVHDDRTDMKQFDRALRRIDGVYSRANKHCKLVIVGHSKGVHLALRKTLYGEGKTYSNVEIRAVIGVAGRIRMTEESEKHHPFRSTYADISRAMKKLGKAVRKTTVDFRTIAGGNDWLVSPDSVLRNPKKRATSTQAVIPFRGHMGVLFSDRTGYRIRRWVREIQQG